MRYAFFQTEAYTALPDGISLAGFFVPVSVAGIENTFLCFFYWIVVLKALK